jgi:hypothetical protein
LTEKALFTYHLEWLWSFFIRGRDGFICQIRNKDNRKCGGDLQAMHIVTRGVPGIKYDKLNGLCGCRDHHKYYTHHPEFWAALIQRHWPERWKYLNDEKWQKVHPDIDRDAIYVDLLQCCEPFLTKFFEFRDKFQKAKDFYAGVKDK